MSSQKSNSASSQGEIIFPSLGMNDEKLRAILDAAELQDEWALSQPDWDIETALDLPSVQSTSHAPLDPLEALYALMHSHPERTTVPKALANSTVPSAPATPAPPPTMPTDAPMAFASTSSAHNVNLQYNQPRYRHRVYVLTPSGPVYVNPYERKNPIELITAQSDRDITVTTEHVVRNDANKVRLDVYYETDCPDSMRFITRQLYPLYQEMEDVLDIHLVPYGKAHETYNDESQKYEHWCQHGPSECYGNTVQSCVISLYPKTKDYLDFIYCMEAYPRPSHSARKCARRLSLDWDKIEKCAKGEEGNRLLHENAQLTENLNPRLYFVPWIVVDKAFTESNQRLALRSLSNVVCNSYKGNHPKCNR